MRGLVSDPGPVLDDVRLVIWNLQTLKEAYSQCRVQLENESQVQLRTYSISRTSLRWQMLHVCVSVSSTTYFMNVGNHQHRSAVG